MSQSEEDKKRPVVDSRKGWVFGTQISDSEIEAGFKAHEPWMSKVVLNGRSYGGERPFFADPRLVKFFERFPSATRILELGCLEGGHTLSMAARPGVEHVTALDARDSNLEKAQFVRGVLGINNVSFVKADLNSFDITGLGTFDVVFCMGVLYHIQRPWELVRQMASVAPGLFLWTHYALDRDATDWIDGHHVKFQGEGDLSHPFSGLQDVSPWLTLGSLIQLLTESGYREIDILENAPNHENGPCITLTATRSSP